MVLVLVCWEWFVEKLGIMPLCLISELFLKYNFLLCSELQEGCKKLTIRNPRHVRRKWWENLEISWVGMVAIFILLQGLVTYVGNFRAIYFGWEDQWCHWSSGENGDLRAFVCYEIKCCKCLVPCYSVYNIQNDNTTNLHIPNTKKMFFFVVLHFYWCKIYNLAVGNHPRIRCVIFLCLHFIK
jgi:hypothetical protein